MSGNLDYLKSLTEDLVDRDGNLFNTVVSSKLEYERAFDSIPDLACVIGKDYKILKVNKAMASRFNKHPRDLVGHTCHSVFHGEDMQAYFCPLRRLADNDIESELNFDPILNTWLLITVSSIKDEHGKTYAYLHIVKDITDCLKKVNLLEAQK